MLNVFNDKYIVKYPYSKDKWGATIYTDGVEVVGSSYGKSNYKRGLYKESINYNYIYIVYDESVCLEAILDGLVVVDIEVVRDINNDYLYTICCAR